MKKQVKYGLWPIGFILIFSAVIVMVSNGANSGESNRVVLNLRESTHADLVDFMYEFAAVHRLNVQWFGWYSGEESDKWYIRTDREANFKIGMFMLTEENGYLFFSSRFDNKNINFDINYGSKKPSWLSIVSHMERELKERGWLAHD